MFNGELKENALKRLKIANTRYQSLAKSVAERAENLHALRLNSSKILIRNAEEYVNTLANSPKEFERTVKELKISFRKFESVLEEIEEKDNVAVVSGSTVGADVTTGAGVTVGVGVVALGPSAAVAIATTFGTASTGTAICALSGAAATNAALAWIGGGALVAGGGGVVAGNAILALSGPIGWGIAGTVLLGGTIWRRSKNKEIAEKATREAIKISKSTGALRAASTAIYQLHKTTKQHSNGATEQLNSLKMKAPKDYREYSVDQKNELGALTNNIKSLSQLIVKNIK